MLWIWAQFVCPDAVTDHEAAPSGGELLCLAPMQCGHVGRPRGTVCHYKGTVEDLPYRPVKLRSPVQLQTCALLAGYPGHDPSFAVAESLERHRIRWTMVALQAICIYPDFCYIRLHRCLQVQGEALYVLSQHCNGVATAIGSQRSRQTEHVELVNPPPVHLPMFEHIRAAVELLRLRQTLPALEEAIDIWQAVAPTVAAVVVERQSSVIAFLANAKLHQRGMQAQAVVRTDGGICAVHDGLDGAPLATSGPVDRRTGL